MPLGALIPVLFHGSGAVTPPASGLSIAILIAGVDRTAYVEEMSWRSLVGGIGTASFVTKDATAVYKPLDGDTLEVVVDGTTVWGGQVTEVQTTFLGWNFGWLSEASAQDWNHIPAREDFNGIVPSQSVYDTLLDLVAPGGALSYYGITLHPSQAFSAAIGVMTLPWKTVEDLLRLAALLRGDVVWIDPQKRVRMWAPGDVPSGLQLSLANGNLIDFTNTVHRLDYRNIQWVIFGPTDVHDATDGWTGDGATQDFNLHYGPAAHPSPIFVGGLPFPVGVYGVDAMEWTFEANVGGNPAYGRFRHTGTAVGSSVAITATFPTNSPNAVLRQDAGEVVSRGRYGGKPEFAADVTDWVEAAALGDALIRKNLARPNMPTLVTYDLSVLPGMTLDVDLLSVGLFETVLAHTVEGRLEKEGTGVRVTSTISCFGNDWHGDLTSLWLRLIGGDSATGGGSSTPASGGTGGGGTTTTITGGLVRLPFGGWKQINPDVWQSVAGNGVAFDLPDGFEYFLTGSQVAGAVILSAHLLTDAGANGTVSIRLFNETDGAAASDWTSGVTASTFTYVSVVATLATAEKVYKVQARVSGSAHATANVAWWSAHLWNRP